MSRRRARIPSRSKPAPKPKIWWKKSLIAAGLILPATAATVHYLWKKPTESLPKTSHQQITQPIIKPSLKLKPNIPFQLTGIYANLLIDNQTRLIRLAELDKKPKLSSSEEKEIPALINEIGRASSSQLQEEYQKRNEVENGRDIYERLKSYENDFGHVSASWYPNQGIFYNCYAHSVAQNILFSTLGSNKVGIFSGPTHGSPTVTIRGRTYVIDPITFHLESAPTLDQFVVQVKDAYVNDTNPGHEFAVSDYSQPFGLAGSLRLSRHHFGINASLAAGENDAGRAFLQEGKNDEGITHLENAIKLQPKSVLPRMDLGGLLLRQGQFDKARAIFKIASQADPSNSLPYAGMAKADMDQGKGQEAIAHLRLAIKNGHPQSSRFEQMIKKISRGNRP